MIRFSALIIFFCIYSLPVLAFQEHLEAEFSIDVLNVRRGLLSNYVTKVVSDEFNTKYFATEGGITKYDGYDFTGYQPSPEYPGLENENIETLFKDRDNLIWIGTKGGGVSRLDPSKNQIESFNSAFTSFSEKALRVISINQGDDGKIWVGTWNEGVFVFNPENEKVEEHFNFDQPIYNIIKDRFGNIWFLAGTHLCKFDPSESRLIRFQTGRNHYNLIEDPGRNKIWMIGNDRNKAILTGFDFETQDLEQKETNFNARFIVSLGLDRQGRIWIGSWGDGLHISDPNLEQFRKVNTNPQGVSEASINYSIILSIDFDKNGIAWLGTSHGGVLILYPNKGFAFSSIKGQEKTVDKNITSLLISKSGKSYFGTLAEGLYSASSEEGFKEVSQVVKSKIHTIYESGDFLFVGTGNGLYVVKQGDFLNSKLYFPNQKITSVLRDSKNRLWVGTQQSGLKMVEFSQYPNLNEWIVFDEKSKDNPLENNRISQIKEGRNGEIWIGTYSGINRFDEEKGKVLDHREVLGDQLPSPIINDLFVKGDTLFLGTPNGLSKLLSSQDRLHLLDFFDKDDGLNHDFICAIEEDAHGDLWISTTTTVSKFQSGLKNFINYDREDGVLVNSFHTGSSFKDERGNIYFGGSNGMISFFPDSITENFNVPEVVLTKLIVNNEVLQVGDEVNGHVILEKSIQNTESIVLDYSQNHLSLSFAANDFLGADNISYSYRLVGINEDWVNLGRLNQISFTGLSWGEYELLLRASRNNQDWSPVRRVMIQIQAPPWLSWYAFVFYILLAVGILTLFRYISIRQARLRAALQVIQIEKQKEHELNEAKITFFTNISHEFRTPLTLILSPVTELLEQYDLKESIREKLLLVESNGKRMLRLINQLLDFRKSEHGLLKLNKTYSDFIGFAKEVFLSFHNLAHKNQIEYHFESEVETFSIEFDRNQMEIVLYNLLSNAFKYTKEKGKITLKIRCDHEYLTVTVSDSGIGMGPEEVEKVFDRFYQVQNSETANLSGSGIGLAFSKNIVDLHEGEIKIYSSKGVGTEVKILFPLEDVQDEYEGKDSLEELSLDFIQDESLEEKMNLQIESNPKAATILIADDNEDIRRYLRNLLEEKYHVLEACDGLAALELINKTLPDVVISDVMMPQMDGIKLCEVLKSQITTSHIPVILLTARTSLAYEMEGLKTGAEDYITKPFNPGIVKTRISNILENRSKLREYYQNKVRFEPDSQQIAEDDIDAQFIEKAIQLVNENLQDESFGIETMVEKLFMSQSTLFRKIKSLTGLSITGFIRSVRLKNAAQIILQSNMKLSQVALEVGFNDYKHFKKSFQQQFGCLPSEYKALMLQKTD
ncbi:two-component regulator propeller domain-containing protein [Algoriphagus sp. CAU 1675]|uniref:hybrid sensor histidine kinase/response regulator transcription factor n=1 Tax=Algoriphagus sp. CAU 1675 TaxID=3032597 RepID=UPI0023DAEC6A|nr:two-component regulator propeller domain-containing protein [Algoriphagus sp. CAU 1675]MDF2159016.1 two-component regulator propeller domain-containing protein [Algoriphagus sp. CAU 1675]